jgi:tetratricopeptide (TPR) repeat protein
MDAQRLRLLSPGQRRLLAFVIGAAVLLLGNSLYLVVAAHGARTGQDPHDLPLSYQGFLILHVVAGVIAFVPAVVFAGWHLRRALRRRTPYAVPTGILVLLLAAFLLLSGLFILSAANSRANRWAFLGHQAAAVMLPLVYVLHRLRSKDRPTRARAAGSTAAVLLLAALMGSIHGLERMARRAPAQATTESAELRPQAAPAGIPDPFVPFRPVGDVDPESPFFPSATTTSSGGFLPTRILTHDDLPDIERFRAETAARGFSAEGHLGAETCQRCHPDIVEQWSRSAHRFASFNNLFYRKSVELMRETRGLKASQWCGGCHDPAIMLAGNMTAEIDPYVPESQAGLTCLACHAIDRIHNITGNGAYNIQDEKPTPYLFAYAKSGLGRALHDYVLKAKPTAHKAEMLKPFFRTAEFCSVCHKVALDVPVNRYRWFRGQNEYDAWHNSGVAHNQPMTWYEPPVVSTCQDCHMPLEDAPLGDVAAKSGKVKSHRFLAVNTALPHIRGDQETIDRTEAFLREAKLRIDIFALHRDDGRLVLAPERGRTRVRPGETVQVDVVVRNQGVGHTFPGGTNDSNEGWVDFAVAAGGMQVWRSGAVREDLHVDPGAHFYQAVFVDKDSRRIERRNPADIHALVYANVIPPSGSDIARYRFRVPDAPEGTRLEISAALRWRKFNRTFTEFVFEGGPVPQLPITTITEARLIIEIGPDDGGTVPADPEQWVRYNDYAIGLFLDGLTRDADRVFGIVQELVPERVDGWRNQARTALREGDLVRAEDLLRKASSVAPEDAKLAFFWGQLLTEQGRLDQAMTAFRRVLESYPASRDAWAGLGRAAWQAGDARASLEAWLEVLAIDPEDALAHHQRALAYKKLAASAADDESRAALEHAAREAERAFEKYKLDEDAQARTQEYRLRHPHENRMSQAIVVHEQDAP